MFSFLNKKNIENASLLIDIGGSKIRSVIRNENNKVPFLCEPKEIYQKVLLKGNNNILLTLLDVIDPFLSKHKFKYIRMAVPGLIINNIIKIAPNLDLIQFDLINKLKDELQARYDFVPDIKIVNDIEAAWHGITSSNEDYTVIFASSGIGGASKRGNEEIGHSVLFNKNKETYIYSSFNGNIDELIGFEYLEEKCSGMHLRKYCEKYNLFTEVIDADLGLKLAQSKDPRAKEILSKAGQELGLGLNAFIDFKVSNGEEEDLNTIYIGGSLGMNEDFFNGVLVTCKKEIKKLNDSNSSELIFKGLLKLT